MNADTQTVKPDKRRLLERLAATGQQHVLAFWDELNSKSQRRLAGQIDAVDLPLVAKLYAGDDDGPDWGRLAARAEPPPAVRLNETAAGSEHRLACESGEQALRDGSVGMIMVAGGQGTRLGFEHPKGMFPLGPVSNRTLFEILIDRLRAVAARYETRIPLFLMTSLATHEETLEYLGKNGHFGLDPRDLQVFCQGVMPAVDIQSGRLLLAAKDSLCLSPDGHGGMLAALQASGCLREAEQRGVQHLFYCQVDNPLVQLCSPALLGYHRLAGSELTTQVVAKRAPLERVGNVVSIDGKLHIIEYSDLPESVARQRDGDGSLRLWAGNIAVHVFNLAFLQRMAGRPEVLPFHVARKKTPHIDLAGKEVDPGTPNAIKFERFIFDLLPWAAKSIVVEADAAEAFSPVKNADQTGVDTPATARAAMVALHSRWLREAGAVVEANVHVEINPRWALDAGEVAERIRPGTRITESTYFVPPHAADRS